MNKEEVYRNMLKGIATQLQKWASESKNYGWSAHQVRPQEKLAAEIWAFLGKTS